MVTDVRDDRFGQAGGRASARRLRLAVWFVVFVAAVTSVSAQTTPVSVEGRDGLYRVRATFSTPQPAAVAHAVLTDYEQIPRFLPDVRTSRVIERDGDRAVVEQEAVAKVLFFSKRVRLVLDITETGTRIVFRDTSGESFRRYEGEWTLRQDGGRTVVGYALTAQPHFDVPDFILHRLLKRDAERMIARLTAEIAARGAASDGLLSRR